jgi:nitronate monooxygenase
MSGAQRNEIAMIITRFTKIFGLDYPLMSAPMAMHSGGHLAAAVSKAGALGSFGGVHQTKGPDWLLGEAEYIRSQTDRPFGIGFITPFIGFVQPLFAAALEAKPDVIAFSFADPGAHAEKAKAAGAKVMCQVQSMTHAREAVAAGADALVAQGNEAGGHTGTMNLLPLLVSVLDAFPDTPVLAYGGISSGRSLAAVLAAGADGAWAGTAFLATPECVEVEEAHKQAVVNSDGEDTIYTRAYDVLWGQPWPEGIAERVQRNEFTDEWHGRYDEIAASREDLQKQVQVAQADFQSGARAILYGQSARSVRSIRPAAEVVRQICGEAERLLRDRPRDLLKS